MIGDSDTEVSSKTFRTIADGYPGLIFQPACKGTFFQNDKQLAPAFLFGQASTHNILQLKGHYETIGMFFYPTALQSIFGLNAGELTDSCIELDLLCRSSGFKISERLSESRSANDQIHIITSFLISQIEKNKRQVDERALNGLSEIILSNGNIPLKQLAKSLHLSERSFERRFKQCVGLSPKLYSRICRFQASLKQLKDNNYSKLSDIAFDNDYADQSHFIRSFKEFTGFSPNQYQQQSALVLDNISGAII